MKLTTTGWIITVGMSLVLLALALAPYLSRWS